MLFIFRILMILESLFWVFIVFLLKYSFFPCAVSNWNCNDKANFFHLTDSSVVEKLLYLSQHNSIFSFSK
jgi:hypothetical protein